MKKAFIILILATCVVAIYLAVPIPQSNTKITLEENVMGAFINYEQAFYDLNQKNLSDHSNRKNDQEDDRYQIQDVDRTYLLLDVERATYALNMQLDQLRKRYPFLKNKISLFHVWQIGVEKQVLSGKYLLYWQGPLLSDQLQMMAMINNKASRENWRVLNNLQKEKGMVLKLSVKQKCRLINQFGKTASSKQLTEQLAILLQHPPQCS